MANFADYSGFDVLSFAMDSSFQDWVLKGENESYWQDVIRNYPGKKSEIEKAQQLLMSIRFKERNPSKELVGKSLKMALAKIERGIPQHRAKIRTGYFRDKWAWASVAASIVFLLGGFWLGYYLANSQTNDAGWMVASRSIDGNKMTEIASADGFKFILASNSHLSYSKGHDNNPTIYLDGAASFDFEQSNKKFTVKTKGISASTTQGKMNISAYSGDSLIKIVVKEGSAELYNSQKTIPLINLIPAKSAQTEEHVITVTSNEQAIFNKSSNSAIIRALDPNSIPFMLIYPVTGNHPGSDALKFKNISLDNLLDTLHKKYHLQFEIDKSVPANNPDFTGTYNINENPFNILILACKKMGLTYELKEGVIIIKTLPDHIKN